ncbi:fasciclin [Pseudalgibacter alginicilyticus]|uniref:Fasciclin n=1 Tax=Pseudalgibacter alginicilyticus TaxID=1736674 RepID=A0A0P0D2Y5_9FLAO|nr:fasciclin domain-containing protein [Pseudalgibacter alginicilyticus]ALJ05279.1 fasciclin [Pseudalgibacter alginicilyticus]
MKPIKQLIQLFVLAVFISSCNNVNKNVPKPSSEAKTETKLTDKTGQAFIENDISTTVLNIAMNSKDHTTLVAAAQAAQLENALVNAGPLMVFAPTNEAFAALPEGTVENLLKPENKNALANILKYHVTPGNYSKDFLKKFKKLGQANNGYVKIEVVNDEPIIGGAKILASIKAGNGIVHVIDKVLLPPTE